MDDILASAGQAAPQTDAPANEAEPNLGQGEQQAPTPTSDSPPQSQGASGEQQAISYEEYQALKSKYDENEQFVSQLRTMAETNVAEEEWNKYKSGVVSELRSVIENAGGDADEIMESLQSSLSSRLDGVRDDFNQKFTAYQSQIQDWATDFEWQSTRENFASELVRKNGLDETILPKLLESNTREEMTKAAETAKYVRDLFMAQGVNQAIDQQGQQRRASGVDNMGNVSSGPLPEQELKPGSASDPHLRAALKSIFGM